MVFFYSQLNLTEDTVGLIIWSAAEIAVTMVCIGIAICRPLYKNVLDTIISKGSSGYGRHNEEPPPLALHTIGGSAMPYIGTGDMSAVPTGHAHDAPSVNDQSINTLEGAEN